MNEYGVLTELDTLRFERLLPGPIERVWAYLTESDKRGTWLASGEMELRPGGRAEFHFRNSELSAHNETIPEKYKQYEDVRFTGRIVRAESPRLLVFTWPEENDTDSEVTFELSSEGDLVRLVLTHRLLEVRATRLSVAAGWHTHLGVLADRLHGRTVRAFWSVVETLEAEYAQRID